jgi:hypothetical protein
MTLAKAKRKRRSKKVGSVRMSLLNLSKRPNEQVWKLIRHACSGLKLKQHPNIRMTVTGSRGWHGCYYEHGDGYDDEDPTPLITIHANTDESYYPQDYKPHREGTGYLPHLILDSTECLIGILAHELCRAWQQEHKYKRKGWRRKVWGARGVYSDRECDAYAIRKVREYRRSPERLQEYEQKVSEAVVNLLPPTLLIHNARLQ